MGCFLVVEAGLLWFLLTPHCRPSLAVLHNDLPSQEQHFGELSWPWSGGKEARTFCSADRSSFHWWNTTFLWGSPSPKMLSLPSAIPWKEDLGIGKEREFQQMVLFVPQTCSPCVRSRALSPSSPPTSALSELSLLLPPWASLVPSLLEDCYLACLQSPSSWETVKGREAFPAFSPCCLFPCPVPSLCCPGLLLSFSHSGFPQAQVQLCLLTVPLLAAAWLPAFSWLCQSDLPGSQPPPSLGRPHVGDSLSSSHWGKVESGAGIRSQHFVFKPFYPGIAKLWMFRFFSPFLKGLGVSHGLIEVLSFNQ